MGRVMMGIQTTAGWRLGGGARLHLVTVETGAMLDIYHIPSPIVHYTVCTHPCRAPHIYTPTISESLLVLGDILWL